MNLCAFILFVPMPAAFPELLSWSALCLRVRKCAPVAVHVRVVLRCLEFVGFFAFYGTLQGIPGALRSAVLSRDVDVIFHWASALYLR